MSPAAAEPQPQQQPQQDWFAANAPKAAAGGDWFSTNAPKPVANTTPLPPQPSTWNVLTQPTEKTDKEYLGYTGPAGVAGATIHGLNDVARGTIGAVKGIRDTVRHPIETAKSLAQVPRMIREVPAAIHDINQSPDPAGHYLDAAQDTAAQGAGQAITTLGTAGAARSVAPIARLGARTAEAAINQKLAPVRPIFNLGTPADEAEAVHIKVPGRDLGLPRPRPIYPGAHLPESPGYNPGAPLPEHPGIFPGAHLPEHPGVFPGAHLPEHPGVFPGAPEPITPPHELLQGNALLRGPQRIPDPAAGLGRIPAGGAGSMVESVASPRSARIASPGRIARPHISEIPEDEWQMGRYAETGQENTPRKPLTSALRKSLTAARAQRIANAGD